MIHTESRGDVRSRARALRLDNDLSIRSIAATLQVPRSTVGGWLRGEGEQRVHVTCPLCREVFIAGSARRRFCKPACKHKHREVFGRLQA